jgi:hypothetical protein
MGLRQPLNTSPLIGDGSMLLQRLPYQRTDGLRPRRLFDELTSDPTQGWLDAIRESVEADLDMPVEMGEAAE